MKIYKFIKCLSIYLVFLFFITSCKKFVEPDFPKNQVSDEFVFTNDITAISSMTGIYSRMIASSGFASGGTSSITVLSGMSADELINYNTVDGNRGQFYLNSLLSTNTLISSFIWNEAYRYIYTSNAILDGLGSSTGVSDSTKRQIEGEAKFIRAFCYFYLINLYGDVPLHLSIYYRITSTASRTPKSQIYQQIIVDLKDAQILLTDSYVTTERVRPNKATVTALLARAYLYIGDWANAESQSTFIINNTSQYSLITPATVFLKNSKEAIWQLLPNSTTLNTKEGNVFILTTAPTNVSLSPLISNAFEPGDSRRTNWIDSITVTGIKYYYAKKYKINTGASPLNEYSMVFRLAEQYLIRAEARSRQNNLSGAITDINLIRVRANLGNLPNTLTQQQVLAVIEQERKVELFTEWGHRWFDLQRTNRADAILGPIKSPNWQNTDILYPIPLSEIQNNPNISQNNGY